MSNYFIVILLIATQLLHSVYCEYVPVYIFEQSNSEDLEQTFSRVTQDTFKDILYSRLNENIPIVVFAEKKLSPEDFVKSGNNVFSNLAKLKESNNITYLPQVEDPTSVLTAVKDHVEVSINNLSEGSSLPTLKSNQILIIDLDDANENENRPELLKRHDENVDRLYNQLLKQFGKLTAIYTGYSPSWVTSEDIIKYRHVRQVLNGETRNEKYFFNSTNFMINFGSKVIKEHKDGNDTLLNITDVTIENNDKPVVTIHSNGAPIILEFGSNETGYWYLTNVTYNNYFFVLPQIAAPFSFSYHCSSLELVNKSNSKLVIEEIQFEFFPNGTESKFNDAYDCIGFTTIPIWSGLFITLILSIIMTMGLTMIMDIKTMDRFDDPKGKTIIINAAE